jgi:thiamine-phosphate pyrophosphorylase
MKPIANGSLYLVLTEEYGRGQEAEAMAAAAVAGGIDLLQMREKRKTRDELLRLGSRLARLCREAGVTFIVNDDPVLARELDADGVHLGQEDLLVHPLPEVRRLLGSEGIIGVSTHSLAQARQAAASDVDYLAFGPVFPTQTKDCALGTAEIREVLRIARQPVFCIGGINRANLDGLLAAGAVNIALISDILQAEDIGRRSAWYKERLAARAGAVEIGINGERELLASPVSIAVLIAARGLAPERVVVEHNGEIVPHERWPHVVVKQGDRLKLVSFVGGG